MKTAAVRPPLSIEEFVCQGKEARQLAIEEKRIQRGVKFATRAAIAACVLLVVYAIAGIVGGVMTLAEVKSFHDHYFASRRGRQEKTSSSPHVGDSSLVVLKWIGSDSSGRFAAGRIGDVE